MRDALRTTDHRNASGSRGCANALFFVQAIAMAKQAIAPVPVREKNSLGRLLPALVLRSKLPQRLELLQVSFSLVDGMFFKWRRSHGSDDKVQQKRKAKQVAALWRVR